MNTQKHQKIRRFLRTHVDPYRILWLILSIPLRYEGGILYLALSLLAELLFLCRIFKGRHGKAYAVLFSTLVVLAVTIMTVTAGCEGPTCDISTR